MVIVAREIGVQLSQLKGWGLEAFRFGVNGVFATVIYFLVMNIITYGFDVGALWASIVSFVPSILFSYVGQSYFVFGSGGRHNFYLPRFMVVTVVLFLFFNFLVWSGVEWAGASPLAMSVVVAFLYPLFSFIMNKFWTFRLAPEVDRA